jgi:hypothetical protein
MKRIEAELSDVATVEDAVRHNLSQSVAQLLSLPESLTVTVN